jgi:hypothetical protein
MEQKKIEGGHMFSFMSHWRKGKFVGDMDSNRRRNKIMNLPEWSTLASLNIGLILSLHWETTFKSIDILIK